MIEVPVGEKATLSTGLVCPFIGPPIQAPLIPSHNRRVQSQEPETMRRPSKENATQRIDPVCPFMGPQILVPVTPSHNQRVLSEEAETIRELSGENTTAATMS